MSSDPFFLPVRSGSGGAAKGKGAGGGAALKRKPLATEKNDKRTPPKQKRKVDKEESEDEDVFDPRSSEKAGADQNSMEDEDEDRYANETPDERRIRLAHQYLQKLESRLGDEDGDLSEKLYQDAIEASGKRLRRLADGVSAAVEGSDWSSARSYRGHRLPVTSTVLSYDESTAFTAAKDASILKWDIESGAKETLVESEKEKGKRYSILSIAADTEGRYLASGGTDKMIRIWDLRSKTLAQTFPGHRGTVAGLSFRTGVAQLFSASFDRTVKVWNVDDMAYVETLYGHTSEVNCISSFSKERATSGGRDTSVRLWKVVEETQLLFRGHSGSVDSLAMINDETVVSGGEDGSLMLWSSQKKKPVSVVQNAHGQTDNNPNWITSVAACPNSDLVASGSCDGTIKLWKAQLNLSLIASVPAVGFINGLAIARSAKFLVAGVSQEHRLGRWRRIPSARNGLLIAPLSSSTDTSTTSAPSSTSSSAKKSTK